MSCSAMAYHADGQCSIGNKSCTKTPSIAFSFGDPQGIEIGANACQSCAVELVNALAFVTHSAGGDEIKLTVKKRKKAVKP